MHRSVGRSARTLLIAIALGAGMLAWGSAPAEAVAVRPTDMRSTVLSVEPDAPITVRVLGGDALLELTVEGGHEVIVEGYNGEPYLRVSPDGTVATNLHSPATALNQSQNPTGSVPADSGAGAAPDWKVTGSDGHVIWHDHRIHAGSITEPLPWTISLTVDGIPTAVHGELRRIAPPSPLPWLMLVAASAATAWFLGHRHPRVGAVVAILGASMLATVTGYLEWASVPSGAGRTIGVVALPVAAAVSTLAAIPVRRPTAKLILMLASISLLAGWLVFRWSILTRSVLVSNLAPALDRGAFAVAAGLVVAAAGLTVAAAGRDLGPAERPTLAADA